MDSVTIEWINNVTLTTAVIINTKAQLRTQLTTRHCLTDRKYTVTQYMVYSLLVTTDITSDTILSTTVTFNYHFNCLIPQTGGLPFTKQTKKQTWISANVNVNVGIAL